MIGEDFGFGDAAFVSILGKYRHKGLAERALGKQAAQKVGDTPRHLECIHCSTCTKQVGTDD